VTAKINFWRLTSIVTVPLLVASGYALFAITARANQELSERATGNRAISAGQSHAKGIQMDAWLGSMIDWYYSKKESEQFEELFIRDFFRDQKGGVFVDVGASDYRDASLTYFLDRHLGWSGLAIDAIEHYRTDYEKHRPRTQFFSFFVGDKDGDKVDFFVVRGNERQSSGVQEIGDLHSKTEAVDKTEVQSVTLNTLLRKAHLEKFDLLNMDIELAEPGALRGFDIAHYQPKLVVIESYPQVRAFMDEYFAKAGYEQIEEYAQHDARNLYFTPKALHAEWKQRKAPWDEVDAQFPPHPFVASADAPRAEPNAAPEH
jgi:FkbM family methyltransferase